MTRSTWIGRLFTTAALAILSAAPATAGLLPVSVTVIPDGKNFRWTYAIVLPTDMRLEAGNYFTIYDFNGYIPGGEQSPAMGARASDWVFSSELTGPTPDRLRPNDDPTIPNLTWTYRGPTIPSGQIGLGNFWAISKYGKSVIDSFTATTARTSDGLADHNITETEVPRLEEPPNPNTVPEPGTLVLAALGLPLLGVARRLRRG